MARVAFVRVRFSSFDLPENCHDQFELELRSDSDDPVFDEIAEREEELGYPLALERRFSPT
jgi:hypothetical protein